MSHIHSEQVITPPELPAHAHDAGAVPAASRRFRRFGRNIVAAASVSLALVAAAPEAGAAANHSPVPVVTATIGEATPSLVPVLPRTVPFERGITAYSWQSDDGPSLFSDMQAVGLTGARLSLMRSNSAYDLSVLQAEIPNAEAHGVDVAVNLGDEPSVSRVGFPQWAARMAVQLPDVHRFIIENEVNNPDPNAFYGFSMQTYVDELYKTYQAIHAVRPDADVCGFGLDSIDADNPLAYFRAAALYAYTKYGGLQNAETCLSFHDYLNTQKGEALAQGYEGVTAQPMYADEVGRDDVSPSQQAIQETQFMNYAVNDPQIWGAYNYRFKDSPTDPFQTGLETADGTKKPLWHALQALPAGK